MTELQRIYDTGAIDWRKDKVYDDNGNLMTRSSWNQTGDGGRNAPLYRKVEKPDSEHQDKDDTPP